MACADEVDDNISSEFYSSVAIRPVFESTLNEQLWWMYPIAKFFGHALYGNLRGGVATMGNFSQFAFVYPG